MDGAEPITSDTNTASSTAVLLLDGAAHAIPRSLALRMLEVLELVERVEGA